MLYFIMTLFTQISVVTAHLVKETKSFKMWTRPHLPSSTVTVSYWQSEKNLNCGRWNNREVSFVKPFNSDCVLNEKYLTQAWMLQWKAWTWTENLYLNSDLDWVLLLRILTGGLRLEDSNLRTPTWGLRIEDSDLRTFLHFPNIGVKTMLCTKN